VKLVVDTSILISALLKKSTVRELLLNPLFEFYVPEHCIEEIERHVNEISKRSGLSVENVYLLLGVLLASVQVVSAKSIVPFIALALSFPNDGIWTEDKHFLEQNRVKVWRTRDLLKLLAE